MKKLMLPFLMLTLAFSSWAQAPSSGYMEYMAGLQNLIQNDLYGKISAVLYDVEEAPAPDAYITFCKEMDQELRGYFEQHSNKLNEEEKKNAFSVGQSMLLQLSDLYMDRNQDLKQKDKVAFVNTYFTELALEKDIQFLNEDLSRAIVMTLHGALGIPFGMPNNDVENLINSQEEPRKELFRAAFINNEMAMLNKSINEIELMTAEYKSDYPNSTHIQDMESNLVSLEKLREGALVQDFSFVDLEGKQVSLADFKDKIIYLDLWASWCGPCINTFKTKTPFFEKKLNDREDIVLMYISIDDKEESWKNYLSKNPMKGVHLYAGNGFDAEIMKYFKVWGIPRYLIIGKDNKLVSPNAPRPGDEAYEALSSLK
ncbi:TlpA family protein disulfide reductase [Fontibacter flavus]|uniref:TlpA family protein disulfide reductase n=2 Tax=Fontibacter flavus TaxID=654838 RepID=A0ABV6FRH3_9BACT